MSNAGKKNIYICLYGHKLITIDRDDGQAPFTVKCQVAGCQTMAESMRYNVAQNIVPTHEWFVPDREHKKRLGFHLRNRVEGGGMILRPIPKPTLKVVKKKKKKAAKKK